MIVSKNMGWNYTNRDERARWIAEKYADLLTDTVLDVGCSERALARYLPSSIYYIGIDVAGKPDIKIDLDVNPIPFPDNHFECVVCTEVLEHLEHIHLVFDELTRVAKHSIIISLPNCWASIKWTLLFGGSNTKFYGLPLNPPEDRHRWFFNYAQAKSFILHKAAQNGLEVVEIEPWGDNFLSPKGLLKRLLVPSCDRRRNLFTSTLWAVLLKRGVTQR